MARAHSSCTRSGPVAAACLAVLAASAPVHRARAQQFELADVAFVEQRSERTSCRIGEPVRVQVRFGLEEQFLAQSAIPLFLRPLELPVALQVPWRNGVSAVRVQAAEALPVDAVVRSIAVDGAEARVQSAGTVDRDGRRFAVHEFVLAVVPLRTGAIELSAAVLRAAWATTFRDDVLQGRVPIDRREGSIASNVLTLQVEPVPMAGRPADYDGAVGQLRMRAALGSDAVAAGEVLQVNVTVEGTANFGAFGPPRFEALGDFHVVGTLQREIASGMEYVISLEPPPGVASGMVPLLRLPFYDPEPPGTFRVAATPPLPFRVVKQEPAAPAATSPPAAPAEPAEREDSHLGLWISVGLVWVLLLVRAKRRIAAFRAAQQQDPGGSGRG